MQITKNYCTQQSMGCCTIYAYYFPGLHYLKWDKLSFVEFEHNKMNCSNRRYVRQKREGERQTDTVLDLFGDFSQRIATSKKKIYYKITEKYINRNKWHLGFFTLGFAVGYSFHGWSALEKRMKWLPTWISNGRI